MRLYLPTLSDVAPGDGAIPDRGHGLPMGQTRRYRQFLAAIRAERGCTCEACGAYARYVHHIVPVSETGINAELAFEPANVLMLCDDCHALMHPLIRNITEWIYGRKDRGRALRR